MLRTVSWRRFLEAPLDIASLVAYRIAFGLILAVEMLRYTGYGWVERDYVQPAFHFTFYGFEWVRPLPGAGMYLHFAALFVAALCVAAGYRPRAAAAVLCAGIGYVFLLEKAVYLNHVYLVTLLCGLMTIPPTGAACSLDAARDPRSGRDHLPRWQLWLLRLQIAIPYVYGGIAKLNADWLVRGEPMRAWLAGASDWPLIGAHVGDPRVIMFTSWAGCFFDLLIVPALLWRRTRVPAALACLCFHVTNSQLFEIGIFPWMMLASSTLFFPPDWPRALLRLAPARPVIVTGARAARLPLGPVAAYVLLQLLLPFRHHLYPHAVMWSEEGQRFSWFMKSHHKESEGRFFARVLPDGREWEIRPRDFLTERQEHAMLIWPDLLQDFARHAAAQLSDSLGRPVAIRAEVRCALNGRTPRLLVDPEVDLAAQPRTLAAASWIRPLAD